MKESQFNRLTGILLLICALLAMLNDMVVSSMMILLGSTCFLVISVMQSLRENK